MATVGAGTLHGAPTRGPTFGRQGDPPKNAALARREMVQIRVNVDFRRMNDGMILVPLLVPLVDSPP